MLPAAALRRELYLSRLHSATEGIGGGSGGRLCGLAATCAAPPLGYLAAGFDSRRRRGPSMRAAPSQKNEGNSEFGAAARSRTFRDCRSRLRRCCWHSSVPRRSSPSPLTVPATRMRARWAGPLTFPRSKALPHVCEEGVKVAAGPTWGGVRVSRDGAACIRLIGTQLRQKRPPTWRRLHPAGG